MKTLDKIKHLDAFLKNKYHLSLGKALNDEEKIDSFIHGKEEADEESLISIAEFFFLSIDIITDENKELPHDEDLKVDETVISVRKGEYENEAGKRKQKHVIKRNYALLNKKQKRSLWINLALVVVPLLAVLIYSYCVVGIDRVSTLNKYAEGNSLSSSQQAIEDNLPKNGEEGVKHYATVKVGAEVENIKNISPSSSSYDVTMLARFDFNQYDFHAMWWEKAKGEKFNADGFYTEDDLLQDNFCFDSTGEGYLPYPDNIPDVIQFNFPSDQHLSSSLEPTSISTLYQEERAAYPGEKSSNTNVDKNDEFSIGNGKISPDSLEYMDKGSAYRDDFSFRFFQKLHFTATINKTFDSPRYPLDSAQFHVYLEPLRSTDYLRYEADKDMSGLSPYFNISNGYSLIKESGDIKNFCVKLNYFVDKDLDASSSSFGKDIIKSEFELIVRANKSGFSVFANNFLNIIAVAIWLILAFYDQSYNNEDSIGMIGTGFFSAISAILLGFSLMSNASMFSLLTVINVFTLIMVLVMGYESIAAKRAKKVGSPSLLAYRTVKVRILLYVLAAFAVLMDIGLPALAYLWIL